MAENQQANRERAETSQFKRAVRLQGGVIEQFQCTTDAPVVIEGHVKGANIRASWVEIVEGGVLSGQIHAQHLIVRGRAMSLNANVGDFFAMDSGVVEDCHVIFNTERGCSIHPQAQILGDVQFSLRKDAATTNPPQQQVATPTPPPQPQPEPQAAPPQSSKGPAPDPAPKADDEVPMTTGEDASKAPSQAPKDEDKAKKLEEASNIEETDDGYTSLEAPRES